MIFVAPDQVSADPNVKLDEEQLNLARALFKSARSAPSPPAPTAAAPPPPGVSPQSERTTGAASFWSFKVMNRWILIGTVCAVGVACIAYAHRPLLGAHSGRPLYVGTVYVLLVLVAFAFA